MKFIFCITILLCPCLSKAQPLSIGQQVPSPVMQLLRNNATIQPSIYVIDFWATWCSSCRKNFPAMAALQAKHEGSLKIVLVNSTTTGDDPQKINSFFKKYYATFPAQQPFEQITNDSIFTKLFPFDAVPHYVWIDSAARVLAITGSQELTTQNIQKAISGLALHTVDKSSLQKLEPGTSLFFQNDNKAVLAQSTIGKADTALYLFQPGTVKHNGPGFQSMLAVSQPLLSLYQRSLHLKSNRMRILLPANSALLHKPVNAELLMPPGSSQKEMSIALVKLLNKNFGLHGRMQTIGSLCYMLQVADTALFKKQQKKAASISKAGHDSTFYKNKAPLFITNTMNSMLLQNAGWPIIISHPAFTQNISLLLPSHTLRGNPQALQKALQHWGLQLLQTSRPLQFFVLEPAQNHP